MATIALIRHGTTSWNKEGRAQGNSDIDLDQEGIQQAELLANRLYGEEWNYIYSSSLGRARQTAEILGKAIGKDLRLDFRLKERSGGQIEGTTEKERIEKWGPNWRDLDLGLEPIDEVQKRGKDILEEINLKHKGEKVLVVTHGAFIQFNFINLVPYFSSKYFDNTSITILSKIRNQWKCELHNCTRHLVGDFKKG